ncbi:MAG: hypothetical protein GY851_33940, partial [bacterium]|nr:hypothetical protein [bacterium]
MLYHLALALRPYFGPANVLTYLTTRAGGAAVTAFLMSLIFGPMVIRGLRALKVGQFIREKHVADLHALHKGKAGTPTMGGALVILATLISVGLWGRWDNRLLVVAVAVFGFLGAVGFLDDFIKLRRKQNEGLSAKAKMAGQIVAGLVLGIYLVMNPITPGKTRLAKGDILDWDAMARVVDEKLHQRSPDTLPYLMDVPATVDPSSEDKDRIVEALNGIIEETDLYASGQWDGVDLNGEGTPLANRHGDGLSERETQRLNRLLLQAAYPGVFGKNVPDLHTKVEIPGLKEVFVPLGIGYILFVLVIIVSTSNAVNLTDGLDGLAAGASVISVLAYTAIAYVVSRVDWSSYLYLIYVPEAAELTV